jgi:hypothetical protein
MMARMATDASGWWSRGQFENTREDGLQTVLDELILGETL